MIMIYLFFFFCYDLKKHQRQKPLVLRFTMIETFTV